MRSLETGRQFEGWFSSRYFLSRRDTADSLRMGWKVPELRETFTTLLLNCISGRTYGSSISH